MNCPNKRFSLPTVLRIARSTVSTIRAFHSKGLIHSDITPGNFLANPGSHNHLCLIDFGVSQPVRGSTMQFPSLPSRRSGTVLCFSIHIHHGLVPGRRDDLLSWFYLLVELLYETLPWSPIHKRRDVIAKKLAFRQSHEFQTLPIPLYDIWTYLEGLEVTDWPNYEDILSPIDRCFLKKEEDDILGHFTLDITANAASLSAKGAAISFFHGCGGIERQVANAGWGEAVQASFNFGSRIHRGFHGL
jgi:serine/threonine protein kinase